MVEQALALQDELQREGVALITEALPRGPTGPYQLQAAIAAIHDEAPNADATDWPQIVALFELLMRMSDNPVVALNHAVAVAMAQGPERGLELLGGLQADERIVRDHRLSQISEHLNHRDFRTRNGSMWTPTAVFCLLPRLIEVGPHIFSSEEWIARREKIVQAR